jgi:hypothetical protein
MQFSGLMFVALCLWHWLLDMLKSFAVRALTVLKPAPCFDVAPVSDACAAFLYYCEDVEYHNLGVRHACQQYMCEQ